MELEVPTYDVLSNRCTGWPEPDRRSLITGSTGKRARASARTAVHLPFDGSVTLGSVPAESLQGWANLADSPQVRHAHHIPAQAGTTAPWPLWLPYSVKQSLISAGIAAPWEHQVVAAEAAHAGHHV